MKKITYLLMLILIADTFAQSNNLFIPINFQKAYEKQTRSYDGKPGKNYWQNTADYFIKAEVVPNERKVIGEETVIYHNNSPDTLKQIVVKTLQDIYRKGNMRDFEIAPEAVTEGMQINKIIYNNSVLFQENNIELIKREGTNLFIKLSPPLLPNKKAELKFSWSCIIPNKSQIRMGAYDSTTFFIAYWYPQIAVYDDIDGWDVINYTGQTETYNDFGNYDVEITVPKNFIVWATGTLQNPDEVFSERILEKYNNALISNEVINIIEEKDYQLGLITKNKDKLIYKFKANNVPDFAFAISNRYLWDGLSLVVDSSSQRRVFISAAYKKDSKDFYNVAHIASKAIESFSTHLPGFPYPYPSMTVFNGQGGMEFPMMCNNSSVNDYAGTVHLTSHEIAHTYFPFFMGINERKYAWMDEGWATMLPFDFQTEFAEGYDPRKRNSDSYSEIAGTDKDIPPIIPSYNIKGPSYRNASYRRPAAAYEFLREILGDDLFKKCLIEYINRWNGKHPTPYDFFFTFNNVANQDLSWFWKPWFFDFSYPDLSIKSFTQNRKKISLTIINKGGLPLPVKIFGHLENGKSELLYKASAKIWEKNKTKLKLKLIPKSKYLKIELNNAQIPDVNREDNIYEINY
ncbi:MAG: M1 family metallopeptidase [Melioribacter sp.]|nr:M1 family metallopeptidase [Melioribacter sp.]